MTYTDLTPGTAFMLDGNPFIVVSSEFHRAQMRKAVMRAKVRNIKTGQLLEKTFTASDKFDAAPVEKVDARYLYEDPDNYYFMDNQTMEEYSCGKNALGDKSKYLTDAMDVTLILFNGSPVQMTLPAHLFLKVVEAPVVVRGDTVTTVFKTVTLENGVKVQCPGFIKEGDVLKISTETDEYLERANNR